MNRFRKTKKEKDRGKEEVEVPESTPAPFGGLFHKNKKEPERKPDFDLAAALPPTDDFRTSLLMPKLSARFSMLREQDDPNSILGKANDDSVLFPKRQSRLNLFGHNPNALGDIDEVSDGSRSSFNLARTGSYASGEGYATDDDRSQQESIMSRARRAEGNNLFGGRQKVYKIPTKSPSSDPEFRGGLGRPVYEHDINHMSVFQRQRLKEKQEREAEAAAAAAAAAEVTQQETAHESEDAFSSVSSTKRTTYSSTASGPTANARISTAATSVDEQPLTAPSFQTLPASGQEIPAFSSKTSTPGMAPERGSVKTRRLYGQGLAQSVQNQQASTLYRLESLSRQRAGTPDLAPMNRAYSRSATNLRDRLQKLAIAEPSPVSSRPTSPPSSATSPKQPPAESDPKPPSIGIPPLSPPVSENEDGTALMAALQPEDHGKATAMGIFNKPKTAYDDNQFSRRQLQMFQGRNTPPQRQRSPPPGRAPPQDSSVRARGLSNASYRPRSGSAASSHYSEAHRPGSRSTAASINASPARPGHVGTFFDNSSPSETEDEGYGPDSRNTRFSIDAEHPAFRSATPSKPSTPTSEQQNQSPLPEIRYSDLHDLKPIAEHEINEIPPAQDTALPEKPDSPTLGPAGLGLSGLVRTHLRTDSDRSSFHPALDPEYPERPTENEAPEARAPDRQSLTDAVSPPPLSINKPPSGPGWRDELVSRHRREGSTETQKEREEFAIELAERRKRVQEKLRDFAESESRAASPVSGRQTPDFGQPKPGNAFALLKNKSSKHGIFNRPEPKGIKGYRYENSSTPALVSDDPWRDDDERPAAHLGKHPNSSSPHIASERSMRSKISAFRRSSQEDSRESSRSRGASPHSSFHSRRDRSSSDASGRSKSRTRRERDGLGTLEEDAVGSHGAFASPDRDQRGITSIASSTRPSIEGSERPPFDRSSSAASGRYRYETSGWPPNSGYHDRPVHTPPVTTPAMIGTAPRPSPAAPPYSANATPPLHELNPDSPSSTPLPPAAYPPHAQPLPQRAPGHNGLQKRFVDKTRISEPTFISCTSNVPTVGLPPGASLSNGMETPPLPPMNPRRRRQTTTQTILGALKGDRHDTHSMLSEPETGGEYSTFSDEGDKRPRPRQQRLRKTSSEGGELNLKARQQILAGPSPAMPAYPPPQAPLDGGMF